MGLLLVFQIISPVGCNLDGNLARLWTFGAGGTMGKRAQGTGMIKGRMCHQGEYKNHKPT